MKEVAVMEKKIFVNLTAHPLLPEQERAAKEQFGVEEFLDASDVLPDEVVNALRQSPADPGELYGLAYRVAGELVNFARREKVHLYVHLPAGSPAFMWALADAWPYSWATPVFSHSRREAVEERLPDGSVVKRSKFVFERFISMGGEEE
jgi:hypothetical protein